MAVTNSFKKSCAVGALMMLLSFPSLVAAQDSDVAQELGVAEDSDNTLLTELLGDPSGFLRAC